MTTQHGLPGPQKIIESRQNPGFKLLKDLVGTARDRRAHQAAWIEGDRLCSAFAGAQQSAGVLVVSAGLPAERIVAAAKKAVRETWVLHPKLFDEISQLDSPIGWGMIIPVSSTVGKLAGDVVVLDRIQDPGNAGTILRSAVAAGVVDIWCVAGTVDLWSPKVLRSAMGAHFSIHVRDSLKPQDVFSLCKGYRLQLLTTANRPEAVSLYSPGLDLARPIAWVFGQEGAGVSADFVRESLAVVIPQSSRVESLNVAAAASICLFEARRRKARL